MVFLQELLYTIVGELINFDSFLCAYLSSVIRGQILYLQELLKIMLKVILPCFLPDLHVNVNLFRDSLELGLSFAVSGDTPTSLAVTRVLFKGPVVLINACLEFLARALNDARSVTAFSRVIKRVLHI